MMKLPAIPFLAAASLDATVAGEYRREDLMVWMKLKKTKEASVLIAAQNK